LRTRLPAVCARVKAAPRTRAGSNPAPADAFDRAGQWEGYSNGHVGDDGTLLSARSDSIFAKARSEARSNRHEGLGPNFTKSSLELDALNNTHR
jgi:hypothetical protein